MSETAPACRALESGDIEGYENQRLDILEQSMQQNYAEIRNLLEKQEEERAAKERAQLENNQQVMQMLMVMSNHLQEAETRRQNVVQSPIESAFQTQSEDTTMFETPTRAEIAREPASIKASPPVFEGKVDGEKLQAFLFQYELYYTQRGFNLTQNDSELIYRLNDSIQGNALKFYQNYMLNPMKQKSWSAIKEEMKRRFTEPNFKQFMRQKLFKIKQEESFPEYVDKFQNLQLSVQLEEETAIIVFIEGLKEFRLKEQIERANPTRLEDAISIAFTEQRIMEKSQRKRESWFGKTQRSNPTFKQSPKSFKNGNKTGEKC